MVDHGRDAPSLEVGSAAEFSLRDHEHDCERLAPAGIAMRTPLGVACISSATCLRVSSGP